MFLNREPCDDTVMLMIDGCSSRPPVDFPHPHLILSLSVCLSASVGRVCQCRRIGQYRPVSASVGQYLPVPSGRVFARTRQSMRLSCHPLEIINPMIPMDGWGWMGG